MPESKEDRAKKLIGDMVLVVLAEEPDPQSRTIRLQDFIRDGKSIIPFFSSKEAFDKSTGGVNIGRPIYGIDRRLFVEMVRPQEIFALNPGVETETTFTGEELKRIFPEPFPKDS